LTNFLPSSFLLNQTGLFVLWIGIFVGLAAMLLYSRSLRNKDNHARV